MIIQIILGFLLIVLSIVVQVIFIEIAAQMLRRRLESSQPDAPLRFSTFVITLSAVTTWMLLGVLAVVCMWAMLFLSLDVFTTLEESFYFSLVAFTTLGFGDVILPTEWRILSGFVAADGFLLFGLNTAVLLEVMMRLRGQD